jgi:hypothetical protein
VVGNSVLPSGRQVERQSSYFQRLDTNKDGVVTLEEFMAQADRNFARCDVNKTVAPTLLSVARRCKGIAECPKRRPPRGGLPSSRRPFCLLREVEHERIAASRPQSPEVDKQAGNKRADADAVETQEPDKQARRCHGWQQI